MVNMLAAFMATILKPGRRPYTVDLDDVRRHWSTSPRPWRTWPGCQSRAQRRARRAA